MGYVMAGLLSGLGQGITLQAQQNREDALLKLKQQYSIDTENRAETREIAKEGREETRDIAKFGRESELKTGLLSLAQKYKQAEGETEFEYKVRLERIKADEVRKTEGVKHGYDVSLENQRSSNNITEAERRLAQEEEIAIRKANSEVDHEDITSDGRKVFYNSRGEVIARSKYRHSFNPSNAGGGGADDADSDGALAAARARREAAARGQGAVTPQDQGKGRAPEPAKPEADPVHARALADLANRYARATPQTHPGLFRNGEKISIEEAKKIIDRRFGK